jgi:hypothetical protein
MATADYCDLFVEKGTVIHATRDFKALSLKEILEQHQIVNVERYIPPSPQVGGWNKFIKTNISNQQPRRKRRAILYDEEPKMKQQPKKGGRGWLHRESEKPPRSLSNQHSIFLFLENKLWVIMFGKLQRKNRYNSRHTASG